MTQEQPQEQQRQRNNNNNNIANINTDISDNDVNFERKLDAITAGFRPFIKDHLLTRITHENCQIIVAYILSLQVEVSPSDTYRQDTIQKLKQLAEFHDPKAFKEMTRDDILALLNRNRKSETEDPLHRWVGTYNQNLIVLLRFFKWLYYPNLGPSDRPLPDVIYNISRIKRKEISTYKPSDLWTEQNDLLFLKYCTSRRDRAWHAVARDTACRVHELISLKVKDVVFEQTDSYQVAKIVVNGKTGTRPLPVTNAIYYLKDWLANGHPMPNNQNAALFCGVGKKNMGRRLVPHTINAVYDNYKKVIFPKLLKDPSTPDQDKQLIRDLLKKPFNPYVRRHTALTEKSKKLPEHILRQYAGWSSSSTMPTKYLHFFGDESFDALLEASGIDLHHHHDGIRKPKDSLKPKLCSNCDEANAPTARICSKCRMILSYDAYIEKQQESEKKDKELETIKRQQETLQMTMSSMMRVLLGQSDTVEIHLDDTDPETVRTFEESWKKQQQEKRQQEHQQKQKKKQP